MEKTSSYVILRSEKGKQAQIMSLVRRQPKKIDEISLQSCSLLKINIAEIITKSRCVEIHGCTISPNGNMIFADHAADELKVMKENGKLIKNINCTSNTHVVACISNESVAVIKGNSVEVINTETEKVDKCFNIFSSPDGVDYFENVIITRRYSAC
ncbi:unnamed protein product [Mytilus edulis]|uniref:Uncharacterized protein n=1 Tax=Mytilus edulis TaxID=6550 RepID=A0A8S3PZI0_MYTED|nr:unnamed protein product [Mytilus edulis]